MFKKNEYLNFSTIILKVIELENINRQIDESKLQKICSLNNGIIDEFISTNNIEGDVVSKAQAKMFVKEENELSNNDLFKRWIGIKYAYSIIWSDKYQFNYEYINETHRSLMRNVKTPGGVWKTKLNQVGSLITASPKDVPILMQNLFTNYLSSKMTEGPSCFNIIPLVSEFLAIHPYEDGNGRMSRLIMNRELYDAGYKFVKYISISKYLWLNKKAYIEALEYRNNAWVSKTINPTHLAKLFHVILDALREAANKALKYQKLKKYSSVEFKKLVPKFLTIPLAISQLLNQMNSANSITSALNWINDLIKENKIRKIGSLKATKYQKI